MSESARTRLAHATPASYWLDSVENAAKFQRFTGSHSCDLGIIGAGFTGLWTALLARKRYPDKRIVVLEASTCGAQASGRNGGFCAPSISHGVGNALKRWPKEAETLIRLGRQNLDELHQDVEALGLDVEFERQGKLNVATMPWQIDGLKAMAQNLKRFGISCTYLEGEALYEKLNSPAYKAGVFEDNYALLNPAKMVHELRRVCLAQGVEIYEHSKVLSLSEKPDAIYLETGLGQLKATELVLATNIFTGLLPALSSKVIPIYDYALVTEPLTGQELNSIGWTRRYGIADAGNQFHYFRKTADNRILWGGYDAIYPYASKLSEELCQRPETFVKLSEQFAQTFPQLAHVNFSHAWGGIIDSSARTTLFAGLKGKRIAYALGFTGQGVSATRFAANTLLDLLAGNKTERTELSMLRRTPVMFPPEPLRYTAVTLAQKGLAHEDATGHRNLLLRTMDAFGVGFDS